MRGSRRLAWLGAAWLALAPIPSGWAATDLDALFERAGVAPSETTLQAPEFALPSLSGGTVRLADYAGRVVLLNFWATWCRPCVTEMPALERLAGRLKDQGLTVLAVSLDMTAAEEVALFVDGYGWGLPILLDPLSDVGDAYAVRVMPTTYIIGRDGTILGRSFGARAWDGAEAAALMESLLRPIQPIVD